MYWGEWRLLPLFSVSACDFLLWLSSLSPFFPPSFRSPLLFNWLYFTLSFSAPVSSLSAYFPLPHSCSQWLSSSPLYITPSVSVALSFSLYNSESVAVFFLPFHPSLSFFFPSILWHPPPPPSLTLSANESFKPRVFGLNRWPTVNAKVWSIESK